MAKRISPKLSRERWIISAATPAVIAGHTLYVAAVLDLETKEIIAFDVSAGTDTAMLAVFCSAVFEFGAPEVVVLDHGQDADIVAQEAAKLGAEVRRAVS